MALTLPRVPAACAALRVAAVSVELCVRRQVPTCPCSALSRSHHCLSSANLPPFVISSIWFWQRGVVARAARAHSLTPSLTHPHSLTIQLSIHIYNHPVARRAGTTTPSTRCYWRCATAATIPACARRRRTLAPTGSTHSVRTSPRRTRQSHASRCVSRTIPPALPPSTAPP